jgi:hypothetical protein
MPSIDGRVSWMRAPFASSQVRIRVSGDPVRGIDAHIAAMRARPSRMRLPVDGKA